MEKNVKISVEIGTISDEAVRKINAYCQEMSCPIVITSNNGFEGRATQFIPEWYAAAEIELSSTVQGMLMGLDAASK